MLSPMGCRLVYTQPNSPSTISAYAKLPCRGKSSITAVLITAIAARSRFLDAARSPARPHRYMVGTLTKAITAFMVPILAPLSPRSVRYRLIKLWNTAFAA